MRGTGACISAGTSGVPVACLPCIIARMMTEASFHVSSMCTRAAKHNIWSSKQHDRAVQLH